MICLQVMCSLHIVYMFFYSCGAHILDNSWCDPRGPKERYTFQENGLSLLITILCKGNDLIMWNRSTFVSVFLTHGLEPSQSDEIIEDAKRCTCIFVIFQRASPSLNVCTFYTQQIGSHVRTDFKLQNLISIDVRFWRIKSILALK